MTAVSADISYSDRGHISKWGIDNRGSAVCEVLLYINGDIQIHGILSDKSKYNYIIKNKGSKDTSNSSKYDKYIGIQLKIIIGLKMLKNLNILYHMLRVLNWMKNGYLSKNYSLFYKYLNYTMRF